MKAKARKSCSNCRRLQTRVAALEVTVARLQEQLTAARKGPKLTTEIAYLKGVCHASFSTIRKYVRDVLRLTIWRGQLAAIIGKVTRALEQPYQGLLESLPGEDWLNTDETSHKQRV